MMAVLIPTSSPLVFTSAPPLLPGLMAASVCMNDSIVCFPCRISIVLPFALTIPAVTVVVRLNGLPTASTHSPTRRESELPKGK